MLWNHLHAPHRTYLAVLQLVVLLAVEDSIGTTQLAPNGDSEPRSPIRLAIPNHCKQDLKSLGHWSSEYTGSTVNHVPGSEAGSAGA
jgi:hypothetical protein